MRDQVKTISVMLITTLLVSCTIIQRSADNKTVRLIFYNEINLVADKTSDCRYLGEIVSSEGHWYSYLFISNADLTRGAINDMHNEANAIGANVVYINNNIDFTTSVTLLGQAYDCEV